MADTMNMTAPQVKRLKAAQLCIQELEGHAIRMEVRRRGIDLNDCPGKAERVKEVEDELEEGKQTVSDLHDELAKLNQKLRFEEDQVKKLEEDLMLEQARIVFEGKATCGTDEKDLLQTARAHLLTHSARSTEHDMKHAILTVTESLLVSLDDGDLRDRVHRVGKRSFDEDAQDMVVKLPRIDCNLSQ